ncbi:hypothetical protein BGZ75_000152 [Mortierella antarctica]|nr:hypothetical protein BGZ75_000152 [Mortierella antarctica]
MQKLSGDMGELNWLPCAAHTIQRCFNAAWAAVPQADQIATKCHELAVLMRGSSTIRRKLDTIQRERYPTARLLTFMIDMPTRWNTKYLMIERMARLSREIKETLLRIKEEFGPDAKLKANRLQEKILIADDLQAAKDMIKILRLPYIITTRVGSSKVPAIPQMYPWIWDMTHGQDLISDSTNVACERMHSVILEQVTVKPLLMNNAGPGPQSFSTYLNPAAKHRELSNVRVTRGHNELLKTHAESLIVQKLLDLIKIKGLPIDPQDDAGNSSDDELENARLAQTGGCPISRRITSELLLYSGHAFRHLARKEKYFDDPLAASSPLARSRSIFVRYYSQTVQPPLVQKYVTDEGKRVLRSSNWLLAGVSEAFFTTNSNDEAAGLPAHLSHLQRKLQYNIRDGISIYRRERDQDTISGLIQDGERDLAMIRAWNSVDPSWLERLFKKPTPKNSWSSNGCRTLTEV